MARPSNSREAKELYELKQRAVEYYSENGVPKKMEELLNSMFYDDPEDVYGHVANYFEGYAKTPTINKVKAMEALDSKGQPTLQTEVYCKIKNFEKLVASSTSNSPNSRLSEAAKIEDIDEEMQEKKDSVTAAVGYINDTLNDKLHFLDPTNQSEADTLVSNEIKKLQEDFEEKNKELEEKEPTPPPQETPPPSKKGKSPTKKGKGPPVVIIPDEPLEKLFSGCNAVGALSKAICEAGAQVKNVPLYEHIATLRLKQAPGSYTLPVPMVTILQSGKAAPGKLNCVKEFMITPKPGMPVQEAAKHISNIYQVIAKQLFQKTGIAAKFVNDNGALVPTMDRPEQGLDMIQEAMTLLELTAGEDFHIVINAAGQECFDFDKGKYEVTTGQQKTAEDTVEFWVELLNRYPSVIGLIDPLRKQDKECWMKLCDRITERLFMIGDHVYHRPGLLNDEEINVDDFKTSGISLRYELMTSVTDIITCSDKVKQNGNIVILSANQAETPDTFIVDLAVGLEVKFLRIGAPCRGERIAKLNRLSQIEAQLTQQKITEQIFYEFPHIQPPPPPEPEEGELVEPEPEKNKSTPKKK
ncbi:unnamed protein product [Owenia fusiformis]|uniref:Enolase 4 n=1 Tax=Owenia fusiformis TaxID=6347 RepID=A0A8J1XFL6_OWEFU|nr:unnamed protein product [Owenia fusiformis]